MVTVIGKKCGYPDCQKFPVFGMVGSKRPEFFCGPHAKEGIMVDVNNKQVWSTNLHKAADVRHGQNQNDK